MEARKTEGGTTVEIPHRMISSRFLTSKGRKEELQKPNGGTAVEILRQTRSYRFPTSTGRQEKMRKAEGGRAFNCSLCNIPPICP